VNGRSGNAPARRWGLCVRSRNRVDSQPTHEAAKTDAVLPEPEAELRRATPRAPEAAGGGAPLTPPTQEG
jgi:hypothetical protein